MNRAAVSPPSGGLLADDEGRWLLKLAPRWLPVLLGMLLGTLSALLIVQGVLVLVVVVVMLIPALVLLIRYPFVVVLLWILIFPYFLHDSSASGRLMFWILHRGMIPIALLSVILADWLRIRTRESVRFGPAELVMLLLLLATVVNVWWLNPNPLRELVRVYDRLFIPCCMYWLVRLVNPTERDLIRLAWVGLITIAAQTSIGVVGWFAPQMLPPHWVGRLGERTVGTFNNPAVFTSTLLFLTLLLVHLGMQRAAWLARLAGIVALSLAYLSVFLSFSRGSWLGATFVWIGLLVIYPRLMVRWTAVALAVMLILAGTLLVTEISWATTRLGDRDTAAGRVLSGATSIRMILERPWFGWGFGTYDIYDEQFKTRVGDLAIRPQETSHNTYLLITAEMGLVGLVLYLLPAVWWLKRSIRSWQYLPRSGIRSRALLALLWLLMLDHFTVSNFMDMVQANLFGTTIWWLALALIAGLAQVGPQRVAAFVLAASVQRGALRR